MEVSSNTYNNLADVVAFESQDINSMVVDPLFQDPENKNFNLVEFSPAIDAGIYVGLQYDINGVPVPVGNAPDIGITEFLSAQVNTEDTVFEMQEVSLRAHPNPVNSILFVRSSLELTGEETIRVYDTFGNLIMELMAGDNLVDQQKFYLNVSPLNPGLYLINLHSGEQISSIKFLKGN
jgi:hypothetical protein